MRALRFLRDPPVEKLRWFLLAVMLADIVLTLAGQPAAFWSHPDSAMRGDGLGIHDPTNHSFEFFLGYGWPAYLAFSAAYIVAAFLLLSILPRQIALVLLFTLALGHIYTGTNWLAIRYHAGMLASSIYGLGLGVPLAVTVGRIARAGPGLNHRISWIAVAALLIDMSFTLLGQPHSYWSHPETAYEGNVVSRYFLVHGWAAFAAYDVVYALGLFFAITTLPRVAGLTVALYFLFCDFVGASNWFFFVWRQGLGAVLGYAFLLSVALIALIFESQPPRPAPST